MSVPWYLMAKGKGRGGYKTASGDIVSFSDGSAAPLRSLRIGIDPVQDLHGYDSPWPAGGGKNLLDPDAKTTSSTNIYFYKDTGVLLKANQAYTLTIYSSENASGIYFHAYPGNTTMAVKYNGKSCTCTPTEDVMAWFDVHYSTAPSGGTAAVNCQLELGSTVTPYAPYSNICPISGWSAVNVWRTGKNLWDIGIITSASGDYGVFLNEDGSITVKSSATSSSMAASKIGGGTAKLSDFIPGVKVGSIVTLSLVSTSFRKQIYLQKSAFVWASNTTRTLTQNDLDSVVYFYANDNSSIATISDIQLELGSPATVYEPYTGNQYTIQLGQTVYGGTLDVTNGVLTVDRAMVDLGTLDWALSFPDFNIFETNSITDMEIPSVRNAPGIICECFKISTATGLNGNMTDYGMLRATTASRLYIRDTAYNDKNAFIAAMSGVKFVYPLATPITIPLSDITVETLAGQNVMWADCGDVTVTYLSSGGADPDLMKLAVAFMGR